jgi:CheY-like chemotaxis protein
MKKCARLSRLHVSAHGGNGSATAGHYVISMEMNEGCAILIVDDDEDLTDSVVTVLAGSGYVLSTASDGISALMALRAMPRQPCVVLTDLQMPGMDGFALIRAIRTDQRLSHVRVVVLSAIAHHAPSGADAVLSKPFELLELRAIISLLCDPLK